jgi:hypothetical protein
MSAKVNKPRKKVRSSAAAPPRQSPNEVFLRWFVVGVLPILLFALCWKFAEGVAAFASIAGLAIVAAFNLPAEFLRRFFR